MVPQRTVSCNCTPYYPLPFLNQGQGILPYEIKFCKLILIGSTRCSLSECYLILACNFNHLKAYLQKKVRRADEVFVNKLFSRECLMAEAQSKMPSKATTTLFSSFML